MRIQDKISFGMELGDRFKERIVSIGEKDKLERYTKLINQTHPNLNADTVIDLTEEGYMIMYKKGNPKSRVAISPNISFNPAKTLVNECPATIQKKEIIMLSRLKYLTLKQNLKNGIISVFKNMPKKFGKG